MGTWGEKPFDNDEALDWAHRLRQTHDVSLLTEAFARVPDHESEALGARAACHGLAAAEVVAGLLGQRGSALPEELAEWVRDHVASQELVDAAQRCVSRIVTRSALRDLWEDSGESDRWKLAVEDLTARLSGPSGGLSGNALPGASAGPTRVGREGRPRSEPTGEASLRHRASLFLNGIVPFDGYTSENQTEDHIRRYIAGGPWDEPGVREDLRLCYSVVLEELGGDDLALYAEPHRDYLRGCGELLRDIMIEIHGHAQPYDDLG